MKKNTFGIILATIALILTISNPSLEDHKSVVKQKLYGQYSNNIKLEPAPTNSDTTGTISDSTSAVPVTADLIDGAISRDSYVFFSLTRATWKSDSKIIGVGFMGNIYITKEILPEN